MGATLVVGCFFLSIVVAVIYVASAAAANTRQLSGGRNFSRLGGGLTTSRQTRGYDWLVRHGVVGQGILLQVSRVPVSVASSSSVKLLAWDVLIDVEVPGQPPYELRTSPSVPSHLSSDILPGATVELRVDPGDPTQLMVFGPGVGLPASLLASNPAASPAPTRLTSTAPAAALGNRCGSCGGTIDTRVATATGKCPVCGASWP